MVQAQVNPGKGCVMTYYPDLSSYEYVGSDDAVNIGWLDIAMPYTTGATSSEFRKKLLEYCRFEFTVNHCMGYHECQYCEDTKPPIRVDCAGESVPLGNGEIRVIGTDLIYAGPTLIYHYVAEHNYKPPDEFIHAVCTGPGPDTEEHHILLKILRDWSNHGGCKEQ